MGKEKFVHILTLKVKLHLRAKIVKAQALNFWRLNFLSTACTQKIISKYALKFCCAKTFCINMRFEPFSVHL